MNEALGYTRVSTVDQNPDLQIDELTAAGCHRVFVERASGARTDRPQLAEVLDRLRPGDTLVVWRLDRLARSLRELIEVVTTLEERGVGLRSLHEQLDTTSPGGKLVFHLFGALAEFERDLIRERTQAGLAAARARARNGGRPTVMTPRKIARAHELYGQGNLTVAEIAQDPPGQPGVDLPPPATWHHAGTEQPRQLSTIRQASRPPPAATTTPHAM
jgi:DNA invertase Pin-like site-specific DNA recombinase